MGNHPSRGGNGAETPRTAPSNTVGGQMLTSSAACDGGHLIPMSGTYPAVAQEWDKIAVAKLILNRQLAPFYRGLQDEYEAMEEPDSDAFAEESAITLDDVTNEQRETQRKARYKELHALLDEVGIKEGQEWTGDQGFAGQRHRESSGRRKAEVEFYERGTTECPICMLNFPSNMNTSRCCDQPVCTECLVQIHRLEPTVQHIDSEPVACPYCVEPDFGVYYKPPAPMNRRDTKGHAVKIEDGPNGSSFSSLRHGSPAIPGSPGMTASPSSSRSLNEPRRKSMSATAPGIVTTDQIYPNWQDKVEAVKATIARRAQRRIVFQQVNGRMIPIGVTGSRDLATMAEAAANANAAQDGSRSSRRGRRSRSDARPDYGQDLEELMMNEAIRLSLLEAEEMERKRKEEEAKKQAAGGSTTVGVPTAASASLAASSMQPSTSSTPDRLDPPKDIRRSSTSSSREAALSSAVGTSILPAIQDLSLTSTSTASRRPTLTASTISPAASSNIPIQSQPITGPTSPPPAIPLLSSTHEPRGRLISQDSSYPDDNASVMMGPYGASLNSLAPSMNPLMSSRAEETASVLDTPASEISETDYSEYNAYTQLEDDDEDNELERPTVEGDSLSKRRTDASQSSNLMEL